MKWPLHYRIPLRLTRAELWWLAVLFLADTYAQHRAECFMRDLFAAYHSPASRRLEALTMAESPMLRAVRRAG